MRRPIATIATWLGGPPASVLIILMATGTLGVRAGAAWLIGCILWSFIAGVILARDFGRFSVAVTTDPPTDLNLLTPGLANLAWHTIQTIENERLSRHALATSADFNQTLLDRLPDALFKIEGAPGTRQIVWRNPAAARAYGAEEAALLRNPQLRAAFADAESSDQPVRISLSLISPVARDVDLTVIRTGDTGKPAPVYLLLTDRTRERELNQMRADFVANASHELRTPLTSLIGFIETLRGPAHDDAEALPRFLSIMADQADRMQRIISDLLSLSRIEMTEHQIPVEAIELVPILRQVERFMDPILRKADCQLTLDIAENLPRLPGDASQLAQVFGNLVDNAIKYCTLKHGKSGGMIVITVRQTPAGEFVQPGILVSVTDNGPGIAREHLPRLTERFYRADKGRARAVGGTGLGLAIVKHVVARHRGRLVIESIEGKSTTCLVWLPETPAGAS